ncbi:aa3-type cytochrome c oxidase subunit IV [Roseibium sp.]|uniref:aa3-type cytochrome c oxidase subunit IV n=1 Tax=Roseibium sp. TaxID=1936156 RepID=UPI003A977E9B
MSDNSAPAMDYDSHERTYEGFINFSKVGTVAVLNIVLCLILFAFGGTAATVFGWIMLIATIAASAIGLALGAKGWVPSAVVFVLTGLLAILTV